MSPVGWLFIWLTVLFLYPVIHGFFAREENEPTAKQYKEWNKEQDEQVKIKNEMEREKFSWVGNPQ